MLKITFCALVSICFFISGVLYPDISLQNPKKKKQEKNEQISLIRKELLTPSKKYLSPAKRNIFTRQRTAAVENGIALSSRGGDFQTPGQKKSPAQRESAVEEVQVDVKYIGYVQSGEKVVALIILEGETYAVESGDILETGVSIGEITPDDMEIFERDSEPKRINLEGEKP
jgi:Tfp pilus assembly protein PilP